MAVKTHNEEHGLDSLDPSIAPARDAVHFRRIVAARTALDAADADLRAAVAAARRAGDSWTTIGVALDITRQAAQQRFGTPREKNAGNTPLLNLQSNSARRPQAANVRGDEAMTGKGDRHVVPNPKGGWDVKAPEAQRASAHTNTQAEAITRAREIASNAGGETVIHGRDGAIRAKDSSGGNDPHPPKG